MWGACLKLRNPINDIRFWETDAVDGTFIAAINEKQQLFFAYYGAYILTQKATAATALAKQMDMKLESSDYYKLQRHVRHIPGEQNKFPDTLSRLVTSGVYMINQQILNEAIHILKVKPSIDLFTNRMN
ncbi:MAG: hypothetical protein EZS28_017829 [Streblomastix strix]|uniref:Uncharacterized protein n=1 Tax=Streblomastix strix TaxID=222440 RepID=A0A5J4VVP9_9EUKA|nr:MAG: hypothetical protein EZS28_017829 [Streblomastix strix]